MKQTEKARGEGQKPIVVLTPDKGMVIINREYADWKAQGAEGDRPPLLLAEEVCLAVTDTADRYTEVTADTAEQYQQEYDEAMQQEQEAEMQEMPADIATDTTAEEEN